MFCYLIIQEMGSQVNGTSLPPKLKGLYPDFSR